jgi:predicted TIM-barrel fold metal-dependent hydrolase
MNRRQFLHGAAASALTTPALAAAAEEKGLPIIDTHQHLWDLVKIMDWSKPGQPDRYYTLADYLDAAAGLNIIKTVYMEVALPPDIHDREAEHVIDLCKRGDNPMAAAVISGSPGSDGFKQYISKYKDNRYIKGVRQILHSAFTPRGVCLQETFVRNIRLLGDLGLSFDICVRPEELSDAVKLVDACPDTRFILDHCGNANPQAKDLSPWRRDMAKIAMRKNVVGKISGIVYYARPNWKADDLAPIVLHVADVFGKDRIMFAGDWPVCTKNATLKQWVETLQSIVSSWKAEDRRKLFHDNAVRVYGLKT